MGRVRRSLGGLRFDLLPRAIRFDLFRSRAKVPRHLPLFLLLQPLAKHILIFRVGLRQVVVAKALPEFQLAAALGITLGHQLQAPFNFR